MLSGGASCLVIKLNEYKFKRRGILLRKISFSWLGLVIIIAFGLMGVRQAQAEEVNDYESNGAVGFYGEYIIEEKPIPEPPAKVVPQPQPEPKPEPKPTPKPIEKIVKPSVKLPQTSSRNNGLVTVIGSFVLLSSFCIMLHQRRGEKV